MKQMSVAVMVIVFMVGVVTPVGAKDNIIKRMSQSCKADIKTYCKDVKRGEGRIVTCLYEHSDQISPQCAEVTKEMVEQAKQIEKEMAPIKEHCSADFDKYCKDVKPGKGRILKCIEKNESNLSPECKDALKEANIKEQCRADFDKYCKDVEPGEGRMRKCIKDNESNLSSECKDALKKIESR